MLLYVAVGFITLAVLCLILSFILGNYDLFILCQVFNVVACTLNLIYKYIEFIH